MFWMACLSPEAFAARDYVLRSIRESKNSNARGEPEVTQRTQPCSEEDNSEE